MTSRAAFALATLPLVVGCYATETADAPDRIEGEFIIGLTDDGSETATVALAERLGLEFVAFRGSDRVAVLASSEANEAEVLAALQAEATVAFAEPHYLYYADRTPDDFGEYLWGLHNTGLNGGTAGADIEAFAAWDVSIGEGVLVAVIDSGLDVTHPDLAPNLWTNPGEIAGNGIDDDGNGYIDDVHGWDFVRDDGDPNDIDGHGTHVAGTVAARGDDGYGLVGTAFGARVMGLKFLEGRWGGSTYDAAAAIRYAVDQGADVINASWAGGGYSTTLRNAINYARARGVLFVAAAGNEGLNNDQYGTYPANYDLSNVVSVAASDRADRVASFSNFGPGSVDVAAPGVQIVSTIPGGDWGWMDGTSMAAPMVSGVAALLRSAQPGIGPEAIRAALMATAEPLSAGASTIASGGRVNAFAALTSIGAVPAPPGDDEDGDAPDEGGDDPGQEPNQDTPAEWSFVPFPVESPHPYGNDFSGWVGIDAPEGAVEMRLHFDRLDVEPGYDFVIVKDLAGNQLIQWTGDQGAIVSDALPAAQVTLHLYTDSSVTEWGIALSGFSWR